MHVIILSFIFLSLPSPNLGYAPGTYNTGQNTDKGHMPNLRIEIKIPDPAGKRTRTSVWEGRDSNDHATATDACYYSLDKISSSRLLSKKLKVNTYRIKLFYYQLYCIVVKVCLSP